MLRQRPHALHIISLTSKDYLKFAMNQAARDTMSPSWILCPALPDLDAISLGRRCCQAMDRRRSFPIWDQRFGLEERLQIQKALVDKRSSSCKSILTQ